MKALFLTMKGGKTLLPILACSFQGNRLSISFETGNMT